MGAPDGGEPSGGLCVERRKASERGYVCGECGLEKV
jgi:hypothetical protein